MLDSTDLMTLRLLRNPIFGMKILRIVKIPNVVMDMIT